MSVVTENCPEGETNGLERGLLQADGKITINSRVRYLISQLDLQIKILCSNLNAKWSDVLDAGQRLELRFIARLEAGQPLLSICWFCFSGWKTR